MENNTVPEPIAQMRYENYVNRVNGKRSEVILCRYTDEADRGKKRN